MTYPASLARVVRVMINVPDLDPLIIDQVAVELGYPDEKVLPADIAMKLRAIQS